MRAAMPRCSAAPSESSCPHREAVAFSIVTTVSVSLFPSGVIVPRRVASSRALRRREIWDGLAANRAPWRPTWLIITGVSESGTSIARVGTG